MHNQNIMFIFDKTNTSLLLQNVFKNAFLNMKLEY